MANRIKFHYQDSKQLRIIKVDGAWGGMTVRSELQMSVYTETMASPTLQEFELKEGGTLGKEISLSMKHTGVVREVEATLLMTPDIAKSIAMWLLNKIEHYEASVKVENPEEASRMEAIPIKVEGE